MNRLELNTGCNGIIITPTRELAQQVYEVATSLSKYTEYKIVKCVGGCDLQSNKQDLRTATMVIGTLGRIHHMVTEKKLNIHKLKFIVLDEADELLEDGINEKLQIVFYKAPCGIQTILISATM